MKVEVINNDNIASLKNLSQAASSEGYGFISKLLIEWELNANCFSEAGEILLGIFEDKECVSVCGLNIDPYLNDHEIGRIRRLYVVPSFRRKGYARLLMGCIIKHARESRFRILRLYTDNPIAAVFYEKNEFYRSQCIFR